MGEKLERMSDDAARTDEGLIELAWEFVREGVEGPIRELWWGEMMGMARREETRRWLEEMKGWKEVVVMAPMGY